MQVLFLLSSVVLSSGVIFIWRGILGIRKIKRLSHVSIESDEAWPRVSIIVAARNEEEKIEEALSSLLHLDYPNQELIVVNDRSTDKTGEILGRLSNQFPHLRVITIENLPSGWLGKNYAHFTGAHTAQGEYLLFTDADIFMEPLTLKKALSYCRVQKLDHLTIMPELIIPEFSLKVALVGFFFFLNYLSRVWKVKDNKSSAFVGIGAFNLFTAEAYRKIGTHEKISLRPDDDMRLGQLVKRMGLSQDVLMGLGLIRLTWYSSVRALIEGLMKNTFSAVNYHFSLVVIGTVMHLIFLIGPIFGLVYGPLFHQILCALFLMSFFIATADGTSWMGQNAWLALGFPLAHLLLIYIVWKASLRTLFRGGIEWRGTFYSLQELRKNKPPLI